MTGEKEKAIELFRSFKVQNERGDWLEVEMNTFVSDLEEPIMKILDELIQLKLPKCPMCGKTISKDLFDKVNQLMPQLVKKEHLFDMRLLFTGEEWEQLATHHFRWLTETVVRQKEKGEGSL